MQQVHGLTPANSKSCLFLATCLYSLSGYTFGITGSRFDRVMLISEGTFSLPHACIHLGVILLALQIPGFTPTCSKHACIHFEVTGK